MTKAMNTQLLSYLGYTPRGIEFLKMAIKKIQPLPTVKARPKSGVPGVNWCDREKKWVVYVKVGDKWEFCGYRCEMDDAKELRSRNLVELKM
jgi:hypothetical protein